MASQSIGRYLVKANLGKGGMAVVYHATDPRFKRDVAIKVLPREFLHDSTFRARFELEAQTIAHLEHSAIVPVYDFGEHDGQPYLVMRYMPGGSLADRIESGPLPLAEVAAILGRIGVALDSAHGQEIIHRDVKPANILFDQYGDAYLSDFGIVKLSEATAQLTGSGIIGTPAYMAPEMAKPGGLSPLVDVYALGVTLFEMVTGRPPYEVLTPVGLLMAHLSEPIPDARNLRPDLPGGVQRIIERAMAKDPSERYQRAGSLAADFETVVIGKAFTEPIVPVPSEVPSADVVSPAVSDRTVTRPRPAPRPVKAGKRRPRSRIAGTMILAAVGVMVCVSIVWLATGAWGRFVSQTVETDYPAPDAATFQLAEAGVSSNNEWAPVVQEFNGVKMALVPAGCFMMGSESGNDDEQPVHQQCFESPFWIDMYEVTNAQYGSPGRWKGADRPREGISWLDAEAYCETRGARLPTEVEWEYAARGPDGLVYPWGDSFVAGNAVYKNNAFMQTANAGSHPGSASWVGAQDMSGNLWEWTYSLYGPYPYQATDGREAGADDGDNRALRGGSWFSTEHFLRTTARAQGGEGDANDYFGFRCARSYDG
jgi:formylglycine-generating enzyme required for sulfatase activity